jgi:hypothetical protein
MPPAVALQQQRGSATTRSSVGSVTTLSNLIRMLYSRAGDYPRNQPHLDAEAFSANTPAGACKACHGLGRVYDATERSMVPDDSLTIRERAIAATEREIRCGGLSEGFDLGRTFAYIRSTRASSPFIRELYDIDSDGNRDEIAAERQAQLISLCRERLGDHAKLLRVDQTDTELCKHYLSELCETAYRDLSAVILGRDSLRSAGNISGT